MKKSLLSKVFIFAAGAAIGSAVTWKIAKEKYERIANEAIESVKEVFGRTRQVDREPNDGSFSTEEKAFNIIKSQSYTNYATNNVEKDSETFGRKLPYIIEPEEYGEKEGYEVSTLTYYADKVLTDYYDDPIENIDEVVGLESLNHFGEYDDEIIYVRNDELKADYEIVLDGREYSELS